jgi:hypothetical protein
VAAEAGAEDGSEDEAVTRTETGVGTDDVAKAEDEADAVETT